jgi:hypothetical protein
MPNISFVIKPSMKAIRDRIKNSITTKNKLAHSQMNNSLVFSITALKPVGTWD